MKNSEHSPWKPHSYLKLCSSNNVPEYDKHKFRLLNRTEYVRFNYKSPTLLTKAYYNKHDYYLAHCKVFQFNKNNLSEIGRSSHQKEKFSFSRLFPGHQVHTFLNI